MIKKLKITDDDIESDTSDEQDPENDPQIQSMPEKVFFYKNTFFVHRHSWSTIVALCVFFLHYMIMRWRTKKSEQKIFIFHGERVLQSWQLFEILGEIRILVRISLQSQFQHKAWFPTKVHWFSVIFKDNLKTLSLAEACLSFPECSEQFFGSLET